MFSANTVAINSTDNAINAIDDGINAINAIDDGINAINDLVDVEENIVNAQNYVKDDRDSQISINLQHNPNSTLEQSFSSAKTGSKV